MILSITPPPSANRMWTSNHRKTPEYRAWETEAGWQIMAQRPKCVDGTVMITIYAPANGMRDLDNHAKPTLDLLVKLGLIEGDRFKTVKRIVMEWHDKPAMLIECAPYGQSISVGSEPLRTDTWVGTVVRSMPL